MTTTHLLQLLSEHQGRTRGISAEDLAAKAGLTKRRLRILITVLRGEGIAICGRPNTGYFMAVTPDELQESCEFLEHRALTSLRLLSRMKKVSMPDLVGQLKLNQA